MFPRISSSCRVLSFRAADLLWVSALLVLVSAFLPAVAAAREHDGRQSFLQAPESLVLPARLGQGYETRSPGDTLFYGYYNGATGLAVEGYPRGASPHTWTFDHGAPSPFEGWYATDLSMNLTSVFRHITSAIWSGHANAVPAPILGGAGSAWAGLFEDEADNLCWIAGLGYGDTWCQRLTSPPIAYSGGSASLSFEYFNDTEPNFDYTHLLLRRPNGEEVSLNLGGFTGQLGLASNHPASIPVGAAFAGTITPATVGAFASFQLIFEVDTDGAWSDEDGSYATAYGPFAVDEVVLSGSSNAFYNFDAGLQGWTRSACAGIGSFMGIRDVALYTLQDPCMCELSGKVLEFHDDLFEHTYGQRVVARSNPADLANAHSQFGAALSIGSIWDQYSELPLANGVFYRPGWSYFPFLCSETGATSWSPRTGQNTFNFIGEDPLCATLVSSATGTGVPNSIERIRYLFEVYASCDAFGIEPTNCSNTTNFTPVIDNINIFATQQVNAPNILFADGYRLQDGFAQSFVLSTTSPGNADVSINQNFGNNPPFVLADVPRVVGPAGVLNPWTAKLHFRVLREGPGAAHAAFAAWQAWKISTGVGIGPGSSFAFGVMDTVEVAGTPVPSRNQFEGYYREDDPNNPSPGTELVDANEILVDNVPPGTYIEYFVSAKFNSGVDVTTLPDTTGGAFAEFEILPSWRSGLSATGRGVDKFPALVYLFEEGPNPRVQPDARRLVVESALEVIYGAPTLGAMDAGESMLRPGMLRGNSQIRGWDRYDYLDATSNWKAPFARGTVGANNGVPLPQLLGYRVISVDSGSLDFAGWPEDYALLSDWLTAVACDGNANVQGLHMNGDNMATLLQTQGPGLLSSRLGAGVVSSSYNEDTSGGPADENFCVNLDAPGTALYGTDNNGGASGGAYTYDAWGNWCPNQFDFDVLQTQGTGVGNRVYTNISTLDETSFAQIARNVTGGGSANYRTVLDGVNWLHLSARSGPLGDPQLECASDSASIVTAVFNELSAALTWLVGGAPGPNAINPCDIGDVDDGTLEGGGPRVSHLVSNTPNPFNPRTEVRFSLALGGRATVRIYDTTGRLVRNLVDDELTAGTHQATWNGTDEQGRRVPAGVYWSQLAAPDGTSSSKRMIVVR